MASFPVRVTRHYLPLVPSYCSCCILQLAQVRRDTQQCDETGVPRRLSQNRPSVPDDPRVAIALLSGKPPEQRRLLTQSDLCCEEVDAAQAAHSTDAA
jgi:hypothetical protein